MDNCYLTDKQKELLRSIAPGLKDGTVADEWSYFSDRGRIRYIEGLSEEVWQQTWAGKVSIADFDSFSDCNFLRHQSGGRYTVNVQKIIDAVESGFGGQNSSQQLPIREGTITVAPDFGLPATSAQFQCDMFMIMPFMLKPIYVDLIQPLAKSLNLEIKLGDDFFSKHDIIREIWSAIYNSKFVIADCTGKNANVFYELGIAHTLGKPAIMIAQDKNDIPFDVQNKRYIIYENTPDGLQVFETQLKDAIMKLLSDLEESS